VIARAQRVEATVRERLRAATSDAHRRLDGHALLVAVLDGEDGLAAYRRMLRAYAPLHARIDAAIVASAHLLPRGFDWRARLKSGWLDCDLARLGLEPLPQADLPAPPEPDGPAALVGLLYTVEGSTLGGRMIAARLRQRFAIDETNGGRFLAGYRADTMRNWHACCGWFETIAFDEAAVTRAIEVALATFASFEAALDAAARD
jgi:heme oxygenase